MDVKEAAIKWDMAEDTVRDLCERGRIRDARLVEGAWQIPELAMNPVLTCSLTTGEILRKISEDAEKSGIRTPILSVEPEFLVRYVCDTNAIEGSRLDLEATRQTLRGHPPEDARPQDIRRALNMRDAIRVSLSLLQKGMPLTPDSIRLLHSHVLAADPANAGVYRTVPVTVGMDYDLPPPSIVAREMERLLKDYHANTRDLVARLALFHLRFESIHPFVDGNGRTGRLILNMELMRHGLPPINIRNADRNMYFYAFSTWQMEQNSDYMIRLVGLYLLHELG